jgi:hypothetical protein
MNVRRVVPIAVLVAAACTAAPSAGAAVSPAQVVFTCTATLNGGWGPGGYGVCGNGRVPALARVEAAGVDDRGTPFAIDDLGMLYAEFSYTSACIANEPPLMGTADGYLTVHGLTAVRNGSTVGARLDVGFRWARSGTEAVVTVTSSRFTFDDWATATVATGGGGATLIPLRNDTVCPHSESGEWALEGHLALAI